MEWVLDASIAVSWCFENERTSQGDAILDRLRDRPAVVPQVWWLEVANALVCALRRGRITPAERSEFLNTLAAHPIHTDGQTSRQAFGEITSLADQFRLTTYDASYLELARRLDVPLATFDSELQAAARQAGVALL